MYACEGIPSFAFNSHASLVILCQSRTPPKYSDHTLGKVTVPVFTVPSLCAGIDQCIPLDKLCDVLCSLGQKEELKYDYITDPQQVRFTTVGLSLCWAPNDTISLQSLSLDLLNKVATSLAQNKTLKRLELRSDGLTQYKDAKLFTQHLVLGAARSTTLTGVYTGFSSWWRDCHIQSECAFLSCIVTVGHLHSLC